MSRDSTVAINSLACYADDMTVTTSLNLYDTRLLIKLYSPT